MGAAEDIKAKLLLEGKKCDNCSRNDRCSFTYYNVCKEWKKKEIIGKT